MLLAARVSAEGIDTEHLFGFIIGTDVGGVGEREFQSQTTGRFSRSSGNYRAISSELELETVPIDNFRVEIGTAFAAHEIGGVAGLDDRRQLSWQGISLDLRYRFLDRDLAPFGMTLAVENHLSRIDESTAAVVENHGTELTLAFDKELFPNTVVAALNLTYQPEWTRVLGIAASEQESTLGGGFALMARVSPSVFLGVEGRYLRKYQGVGLDEFVGQALFVGPTAYLQLSERSRLTATWNLQAWGRSPRSGSALDLADFERHQARLVFGVSF